MSFQVEFVKFDEWRSAPKAVSCLAAQFETAEQAETEAERAIVRNAAALGIEGFRIVDSGALIITQKLARSA